MSCPSAARRIPHGTDDTTCPVKFLRGIPTGDPESVLRFHREVPPAGQLSHPRIIRVFDSGEIDGQLFYSMEYLAEARSLGQVIDNSDSCATIVPPGLELVSVSPRPSQRRSRS